MSVRLRQRKEFDVFLGSRHIGAVIQYRTRGDWTVLHTDGQGNWYGSELADTKRQAVSILVRAAK